MPCTQTQVGRPIPYLTRYALTLLIPWTLIISVLAGLIIHLNSKATIKQAENEARTYHRLNLHYRAWGARLGGVYASVDKVTPNPYLNAAGRIVTTTDGRQLTLINPAYMTRMVFDDLNASYPDGVVSKLTSTAPKNPNNVPDEWEKQALASFERGEKQDVSQVISLHGQPYLRLISRFVTEKPCLKCHAQDGYREGDIRCVAIWSGFLTRDLTAMYQSLLALESLLSN
jgi:hypothetical protein